MIIGRNGILNAYAMHLASQGSPFLEVWDRVKAANVLFADPLPGEEIEQTILEPLRKAMQVPIHPHPKPAPIAETGDADLTTTMRGDGRVLLQATSEKGRDALSGHAWLEMSPDTYARWTRWRDQTLVVRDAA